MTARYSRLSQHFLYNASYEILEVQANLRSIEPLHLPIHLPSSYPLFIRQAIEERPEGVVNVAQRSEPGWPGREADDAGGKS